MYSSVFSLGKATKPIGHNRRKSGSKIANELRTIHRDRFNFLQVMVGAVCVWMWMRLFLSCSIFLFPTLRIYSVRSLVVIVWALFFNFHLIPFHILFLQSFLVSVCGKLWFRVDDAIETCNNKKSQAQFDETLWWCCGWLLDSNKRRYVFVHFFQLFDYVHFIGNGDDAHHHQHHSIEPQCIYLYNIYLPTSTPFTIL